MEKKINVWLDGYWQAKLNKPKIQYTSISLDQMLVEAIEQLEGQKISQIVKEIMKEKTLFTYPGPRPRPKQVYPSSSH